MQVLLVEDEIDLADAMARGLRRAGLSVDLAGDGSEGLELAGHARYDVVVVDREVGGTPSGDDVCRRIAADAVAPVLMLSARDGLDDRVSGFEAGADDYLVKPFEFRELIHRLRALDRPLQRSGS